MVIHFKFHRNPFRGFGAPGGQNLAFPITLASRFYNSLYYRTSRDKPTLSMLQTWYITACTLTKSVTLTVSAVMSKIWVVLRRHWGDSQIQCSVTCLQQMPAVIKNVADNQLANYAQKHNPAAEGWNIFLTSFSRATASTTQSWIALITWFTESYSSVHNEYELQVIKIKEFKQRLNKFWQSM